MNPIWYLKFYPYRLLLTPEEEENQTLWLPPNTPWEAPSDRAFIVTSGHMRIVRRLPNHSSLTVEVLNPGEVVGTFSVKRDGSDGTEQAIAMADGCKGVLLDRNTLLRRAATWELPPITVRCLIGLSLTTLQTHPLHLLFRPLEARLASALLLIAQSSSIEGQGRFLVIPPPPPSLLVLSDLAGCNHELAYDVLSRWREQGIVQRPYKWLTILDKEALIAIANSAEEQEEHATTTT
jgi:CRP-like cAMP-binding protein